ncbi:MAG: glycogen synthase GlgA [Gammaproteobacteria bacterium]|nr:glycogen synthase GlgA [Gammaproteobacteria bacterium]
MGQLKVALVAAECAPLAKTGGLGDVVGALAGALVRAGADVRVILPHYRSVPQPDGKWPVIATLADGVVREARLPSGVTVWLLDRPDLFDRPGLYQDGDGHDFADNAMRFGWFGKRAAEIVAGAQMPLGWKADVVHAHDWHAGLVPLWLRFSGKCPVMVQTIHNLAFQGCFPSDTVAALGLPPASYQPDGAEFYGRLSFLKAGLYYSDAITTVSEGYAEEITTTEFGFGMEGLLQARHKDLSGIRNGIDTAEWNPAADGRIARTYDRDHLAGKAINKRFLQQTLGLDASGDAPLCAMVSRMTWQKGTDLVVEVAERLIGAGAQLVLLGNGDRPLEQMAAALAARYPSAVAVRIGFDEGLAHQLEAGADIFLMPSRFEPCGLNQMYSQRYGTPPVARATGGLRDTITAYEDESSLATATGFLFKEVDGDSLWRTLEKALALYRRRDAWVRLQRNGMSRDFGWQDSAARYLALYEKIIAMKTRR